MEERTVDPLRHWLGVANRATPTHYDLLGLHPLESDAEVIRFVSAFRRAYLKRRSAERGDAAAALVAKTKLAEETLLDPTRKAAYDAELIARSPGLAPPPPAAANDHRRKWLGVVWLEPGAPPDHLILGLDPDDRDPLALSCAVDQRVEALRGLEKSLAGEPQRQATALLAEIFRAQKRWKERIAESRAAGEPASSLDVAAGPNPAPFPAPLDLGSSVHGATASPVPTAPASSIWGPPVAPTAPSSISRGSGFGPAPVAPPFSSPVAVASGSSIASGGPLGPVAPVRPIAAPAAVAGISPAPVRVVPSPAVGVEPTRGAGAVRSIALVGVGALVAVAAMFALNGLSRSNTAERRVAERTPEPAPAVAATEATPAPASVESPFPGALDASASAPKAAPETPAPLFADYEPSPPERVGDWTFADGEATAAADGRGRSCRLVFGDPVWSEYNLKVEAYAVDPGVRLELLVLVDSAKNAACRLALAGDRVIALGSNASAASARPKTGVWHALEIRVRGADVRAFVDGRQTAQTRDRGRVEGRVGLLVGGTGTARFRNLEIRALDGTILRRGWPRPDPASLPAAPTASVAASESPVSPEPARVAPAATNVVASPDRAPPGARPLELVAPPAAAPAAPNDAPATASVVPPSANPPAMEDEPASDEPTEPEPELFTLKVDAADVSGAGFLAIKAGDLVTISARGQWNYDPKNKGVCGPNGAIVDRFNKLGYLEASLAGESFEAGDSYRFISNVDGYLTFAMHDDANAHLDNSGQLDVSVAIVRAGRFAPPETLAPPASLKNQRHFEKPAGVTRSKSVARVRTTTPKPAAESPATASASRVEAKPPAVAANDDAARRGTREKILDVAARGRAEVPDVSTLNEQIERVDDTIKSELAVAKGYRPKAELCGDLLRSSRTSRLPRYAVLERARRLAMESCDPDAIVTTVRVIDEEFAVSRNDLLIATFRDAVPEAKTEEARVWLGQGIPEVVEAFLASGDPSAAAALAAIGDDLARKTNDRDLRTRLRDLKDRSDAAASGKK